MIGDLTTDEQKCVRTALRFLRARCGGWGPLAKLLHAKPESLAKTAGGKIASAGIAFRVARLAGVAVDDVVTGRYPPTGACPHCGHSAAPFAPPTRC